MRTRIFIILATCAMLAACHKSPSSTPVDSDDVTALTSLADTIVCNGDTVIHAPMRYRDFDKVDSLQVFFRELMTEHPLFVWEAHESLADEVADCIGQLEAYRRGERPYYPDSLVSSCLIALESNWEVCYREFGMMEDYCIIEWFLMCAAYYCSDLAWIDGEQTPDHCAGFINIGNPYVATACCCYMFLRRDKGFEVKCLGKNSMALEIYQLSDEQNRTYYLCSYNIPSFFGQWVYWRNEKGEYLRVAECTDAPDYLQGNDILHFSPEKLWWQYAYINDDGDFVDLRDEPALRLFLDGENSRIICCL